MKHVYLFLLFCMAGFASYAQTAASYTFTRTTGTYASISGSGTLVTSINTDDAAVGGIPIGFTFRYCGTNYTSIAACSNGWLSIANNTTMGTLSGDANYILAGKVFPFWRDGHGGYGGSNCYYSTTGSPGSRVFTWEWFNWDAYSGYTGQDMQIQVKLFEGSNIVQFCYGPSTLSTTLSNYSIGIGNSTSDYQVLPSGTATTTTTTFNTACTIPANGTILQWSFCNPVLSGGTAPFCAGTSTTLTSSITGGTWSSGASSVATVGASTGIVTGVSGGTVTISYLAPCGTTATKEVTINPAPATPSGNVPVCTGQTINLTNPSGSGTWASSNTAIATIDATSGIVSGVAAGNANVTFTLDLNGCRSVAQLTVNTSPASVTGPSDVCPGLTIALSDATAGGTWSSSNTTTATVNVGTGVVTGMSSGSVTISYTMPATGCAAIWPLTVNTPPPSIGGPGVVCVNATINLTNPVTGGTWSSGTPSVITVVPGTGVVTGVSAGAANITYTAPSGCITAKAISVNPSPLPIGGVATVCVGSTTTLSDATPGGSWSTGSPALATVVAGTGVVTGMSAGTPLITYTTAITNCRTTIPVTVNPLPSPISGSANACVGASITLSNTGGGTWASGSTGVATIGITSGILNGIAPGTTVITYTLPTGCSINTSVIVNPLPTTYAVTGGGAYCTGGSGVHVGLAYAGSGVNYQLRNGGIPVGVAVAGSNSGLDFGAQTAAGIYTVTANNPLTGCNRTMTGSVTVSINSLPAVFSVTGGGNFCVGTAGVPVGTDGSEFGKQYQLYQGTTSLGSPLTGTGLPLNFGVFNTPGNYTVWAVNTVTGCTVQMAGNADIIANPVPATYTVTGGGGYCPGGAPVHILLSGSTAGSNYQLYNGGPVGPPATGTGSGIDFGGFTTTGTYTVIVTDGTTGCTNNMTGSATIVISPLPVVYNVTGGGGYCTGDAGVHVGLSYGSPGISYELWYGGSAISTVVGSGSGLDFGLQMTPGIYTVVATNSATGCVNNMSGSANISINPLPSTYTVTGGGNFCLGTPGVHVGTDLSDAGINYRLYRGATPVGTVLAGTGGALDFGVFTTPGTYTATATNAVTGCMAAQLGNAVVTPSPLPVLHAVTGGGNYCSGGAGVHVMLAGSNPGIDYELYYGGTPTGIILSGTGTPLDFGPQFAAGIYMVLARDVITGCTKNMTGSATVSINPLPNIFSITGGGTYCSGGAGIRLGLDGSNTGISYRLFNTGGPVGPAVAGTGGVLDFGFKTTADNYYVIGRNPITTCETTMNGGASITTNPLPSDYAIGGGGSYCAGGIGLNVTLANSDLGVDYQLYHNGLVSGAPVTGTGMGLDFGLQAAAGTYNVVARDAFTGCVRNMPGAVIINIISPAAYTVTGGGSYCTGGTGVLVGLSGSQTGVDYQLYTSGLPGTILAGTGGPLDFGLQTAAGIDSIVATNTSYGCMKLMTGTATVGINPLPVMHNVTGGGIYCAGGTGVHVGLDNSGTGIRYQLYNDATAAGTPVTGTGISLDFGTHTAAGNYTVIATNIATLCSDNMAGSAVITVRPLPAAFEVKITGVDPGYPGYFCASDTGVHIYLPSSESGVGYQLYRGTTMIGSPVTGTGALLDLGLQVVAGSYTVLGTDIGVGGCANNMTGSVNVNIVPLPQVYTVTGGGSYCPGGSGMPVGLSLSDVGIYYKLYRSGVEIDTILYGTGVGINFGIWDTAVYTIRGFSHITDCPNNMFGKATVTIDSVRTPVVVLQAYPGPGVGVWHIDSLHAQVINGGPAPTYQWYINGNLLPGATGASLTRREFFNKDSVSVVVTASGACGGFTVAKHMIITLTGVGVNQVSSTVSDIRIIPNPNKGVFTVKGTTASADGEEVSLDVMNMLGQVVYSSRAKVMNGMIDEHIELSSSLANGMYILNLRSGTENTVFHFVITQ